MGIVKANLNNGTPYGNFIQKNGGSNNYTTRDWAVSGIEDINIDQVNNRYDKYDAPYAVPSGFLLSTGGKYILPPEHGPVAEFFVENKGSQTIEVGINVDVSGSWGSGSGIVLEANESYRFGGDGTQVIRNVWGLADSGTPLIVGYATNLKTWV